jgi:uncharacterized protein (DUF58 family)
MSSAESPYLRPDVLARIADLELRARTVIEGLVSGLHRSPYQGQSVEFVQHREYVPGDDLRRLDWRVYGKSDRFYVKLYEEETNLRALLLLDVSASMRYPDPPPPGRLSKFEYAATLAAALAYLLVHQQDAVGLTLFDDDVRAELPPQSHHGHLRALLHLLEQARLQPTTDTRGVFTRLAGQIRRRSLIVLISDLLADPDDVLRGLRRMRHAGHEVIVMHVLDADERSFPFLDQARFEGLEAPSLEVRADPQSLRAAYLDALGRFLGRLRADCLANRVDCVELTTTDALDVALRRYLGSRERLSRARA